jgi:hypothetical protein
MLLELLHKGNVQHLAMEIVSASYDCSLMDPAASSYVASLPAVKLSLLADLCVRVQLRSGQSITIFDSLGKTLRQRR